MILLIFLIILIVLIILLLIPIKMKIIFENSTFDIKFLYAFFKFNINNRGKGSKKNKSPKKDENHNNIIQNAPYLKTLRIVFPIFILLFKKIKLKKMHLFLKISSNDAKSCALIYSYVYSFLKSTINILDIKSKVKNLKIKLIPDFLSSEISYEGELVLSISLLDIFSVLIYGIFIYVKNSKELRE